MPVNTEPAAPDTVAVAAAGKWKAVQYRYGQKLLIRPDAPMPTVVVREYVPGIRASAAVPGAAL